MEQSNGLQEDQDINIIEPPVIPAFCSRCVCVCERLLSVGTVSMPMHRSLDMQAHVLSLLVMRMMKSHWIGYPLLLRSKTLKNKAGGN